MFSDFVLEGVRVEAPNGSTVDASAQRNALATIRTIRANGIPNPWTSLAGESNEAARAPQPKTPDRAPRRSRVHDEQMSSKARAACAAKFGR